MRFSFLFVILLLAALCTLRLPAADEKKLPEKTPSDIGGKNLQEWIKEINDPDPAVVENAIRTVVHFGKESREAGPALIEKLDHHDPSIRTNAALALGMINVELHSGDVKKAIDKLAAKMTEDRQAIVRLHATLALSRFGMEARPVMGALILTSAATTDTSWETRKAAVDALSAAGGEKDKPPEPRALKALVAALNDKCARVRLEAVMALGILGKPATKAELDTELKALANKFKDPNETVAIAAHASYMAVDEITPENLGNIAEFLKSPKLPTRCQAAEALSMFGAEAEAFIPHLVKMLKDKQPAAASAAALALSKLDKDRKDQKPVPKITERLRKEALPVMAEVLSEKNLDDGLREVLLAVLEHFDVKPAKPPVTPRPPAADDKKPKEQPPLEFGGKKLKEWIAEIKDPDPGVVENAIRTIVHFGKDARDAAPHLIEQLEHKDPSIRTNAALALGTIGEDLFKNDAVKAVEKLAHKMSTDEQAIVRFHAALALSRIGADAHAVLNDLIQASSTGPSWEIRKAAVIALGAAGAVREKGVDPRATAALVKALGDRCAQVRLEAVMGLGILGKPASNADLQTVLTALGNRIKSDREDETVKIWAYAAYMAVDGVNAKKLGKIAEFLKSPKLPARCHAAKALSMFGSDAEASIPELVATLHDKQPTAASAAAEALAHMDKDLKAEKPKSDPKITARLRKEALPIMADMVNDKNLDEGLREVLLGVLDHYDYKPADKKSGDKSGR
jgi:HEAT repeat protein